MPSSPIFCDAHTHLDQYEQYDPAELPGILERSHEAGVGYVVLAGTTMESTERCIALADEHPMVLRRRRHPSDATPTIPWTTRSTPAWRPWPATIPPSSASPKSASTTYPILPTMKSRIRYSASTSTLPRA